MQTRLSCACSLEAQPQMSRCPRAADDHAATPIAQNKDGRTHDRRESMRGEGHRVASTKSSTEAKRAAGRKSAQTKVASICPRATRCRHRRAPASAAAIIRSTKRKRDAGPCATTQWSRSRLRARPQRMPAIACGTNPAIYATGIRKSAHCNFELTPPRSTAMEDSRAWMRREGASAASPP